VRWITTRSRIVLNNAAHNRASINESLEARYSQFITDVQGCLEGRP
jgi:hypothetical protein